MLTNINIDEYENIKEKALDLTYDPYDFQKQGAVLVDKAYHNDSSAPNILVAAPTGSGKSFFIHWAAKRAVETGQKLVVAVPLVALAEQIYAQLRKKLAGVEVACCPEYPDEYEFGFDYDDDEEYGRYSSTTSSYLEPDQDSGESLVGIRTGPSEKYPDAPVLVCTYEVVLIQMNTNFRFMDNCPMVIIDEIHMLSDPDRGHVPENIMCHPNLPATTSIVGLSGTLPNVKELATFIGKCNSKVTHIVGTSKRPIDLNYWIHTTKEDWKGEQLQHIYNSESKRFKEDIWESLQSIKLPDQLNQRMQRQRVVQLIHLLDEKDKLPAMVVAFACNRLTWLSQQLSATDLLPVKGKKSRVHVQFLRLKKRIPEEEWCLFEPLMDLAKRGIGVHHSKNPKHYLELLPDLVQQGLVKLIFATSTLSAGIDLPVRTTVLLDLMMPSAEKDFRPIETNLFHQICGRAGRPGLETEGNVVMTMWNKMPEIDLAALMQAPATPVKSQYKLTANTVLNILMRPESDTTVEHLLRNSFGTPDVCKLPQEIRSLRQQVDALLKKTPSAKPIARSPVIRSPTGCGRGQ